jgi:hypothetical protein
MEAVGGKLARPSHAHVATCAREVSNTVAPHALRHSSSVAGELEARFNEMQLKLWRDSRLMRESVRVREEEGYKR